MIYQGISAVAGLLGLVLLLAAAKILLRKGWLKGFAIGSSGLIVLLFITAISLGAVDLFNYTAAEKNSPVIQISFSETSKQNYSARISSPSFKNEKRFELKGDIWAVDAEVLRIPSTKVLPAYRLNTISSDYYAFEDVVAGKSSHVVSYKKKGVNLWAFLDSNKWLAYPLEARQFKLPFTPMADNALYEVRLTRRGLVVTPMNDIAKELGQ